VSADTTDVHVSDGVVTLRGHATSEAQKELTTEYAKDIEGVKDVRNEMTVSKPSEATTTRVIGRIDDASITAQVKMALLFHRSTSALSTKVETSDGVVTLYGKARNTAEKDLVNKLVTDIHGVRSINNRMTTE
jgi:osmotically-inducible protein OsmY